MNDEVPVKRWTAKRKSALVIDIFNSKTTPVEVARQHDLTVAAVERWVEEAERNMENGFRTRPKDIASNTKRSCRRPERHSGMRTCRYTR